MKTSVIIKNLKQIEDIKDLVDVFIVPVKDFSINYFNVFTLDEIEKLKQYDKEIFVLINKNISNNELKTLTNLLKKIESLNIDGIIFYDIAVIKIKKDLNLKTPLVWSQEHMVNNYGTINYWYDKGVQYAYLSSELSKEEIMEIKENAKAKLFINVFGHIPMFTSKRHLVNNYTEYFNLPSLSGNLKLLKEEKAYPIIDDKYGTTVYSDYVLNILDENISDFDYIVFNSNLIDDVDFKNVLVEFKTENKNYKFPFNHGFLYKEIVYKVKNNE